MSNVLPFKASENFSTVTFRSNEWKLDTQDMVDYKARHTYTSSDGNCPDWLAGVTEFRVAANHDKGSEPFETVNFEVYVAGRQSNEHFKLTRSDAIALRDMFAQVATTMRD